MDDNPMPVSNQQNNNWQDNGSVNGLGTPPPVPDQSNPNGALDVSHDDSSSTGTMPDPMTNPMPPMSDNMGMSMDQPAPAAAPANTNDLLDIKSQALSQLSPLMNHLDQTPEEKFKTTMMMIQASDNQALIKDAYDAAQQISDNQVKAQALLDLINEINYFTRQAG